MKKIEIESLSELPKVAEAVLEEALDLGYEEYFYSGELCLVEWPEKIEPLLPEDAMTVTITVGEDEHRCFTID